MDVYEKLGVIERNQNIRNNELGEPTEDELAEFVSAVRELAVRRVVMKLLLELSRTPPETDEVLQYIERTFCDAMDPRLGKGSGAVLYNEPFLHHLTSYCTLPGVGKQEHLDSWYQTTFIDGQNFCEYQQRQVRVYCNCFPLSTRTVSHFCLTSSGQATQFADSVPTHHTRKLSEKTMTYALTHGLDPDSERTGGDYLKYVKAERDAVKSGNYSPFCHKDKIIAGVEQSYELTIKALEEKVNEELDEETKSINAGAGTKTFQKAIDEGYTLLDTKMDPFQKLGHRSILIFLDANGKCSEFYHLNTDTSQGCKWAIEQINKQLQKERNHPVAKRLLMQYLTFLKDRAGQITKKTADATDTVEVTGATTGAPNTSIAKPKTNVIAKQSKKRKASSERPIYADLKKWEKAHKTKNDMSTAGQDMYELAGVQLLLQDPPGTTVEIYFGWSDDEKLRMIASVHALTPLELLPGLPSGYNPLQQFKCEPIDCC